MLQVAEIFHSIQGESTAAGRPCVFVRLSGCNLACRYCDTEYAREATGQGMSMAEILAAVSLFNCRLVEVTGGEPLLQPETPELLEKLAEAGYEVLVESNGTLPLPESRRWRAILDMKCPGSGAADSFAPVNLERLRKGDEIKFVVGGRADFEWALGRIAELDLTALGCELLFSPVFGKCSPDQLAAWILASAPSPPVRMQLQLHRHIWPLA